MALSQPQLVELNRMMNQLFSLDEIQTLCFEMGIDFESLPGAGKSGKIRELVEFCQRRGRDEELLARVQAGRPPQPQSQPQPGKKITILLLAANPRGVDRLRLDEEVRTIDERLRLAQYRDRFNLEQQWAVRTGDILDAMLRFKPDIVHFSGHGSLDGDLIFEDAAGHARPVSAAALGALFRALEGVRCVVMNACWSAAHASQVAEHVDCVVGMARTVSDEAAIGFAAGFYRSLGEGKSVGKAFELGKTQILLDGGDEEQIPQLESRRGVDPASVTFA